MLEYHDHGLELSNQEVLICLLGGGGGGEAGVVVDGVKVVVPAEPREKPKKETYFVTRHHQHLSEDPLLIFATFR